MKVLVTAASKYGSTAEIAQAIGDVLAGRGVDATVMPFDGATAVDDYDAVVFGSAVYAGHWLSPAKEFVQRNALALADRPVWLFSSGPIGEPPKPAEDPSTPSPWWRRPPPATIGCSPASWTGGGWASPRRRSPWPCGRHTATSGTGPRSAHGRRRSPMPCNPHKGRRGHRGQFGQGAVQAA